MKAQSVHFKLIFINWNGVFPNLYGPIIYIYCFSVSSVKVGKIIIED